MSQYEAAIANTAIQNLNSDGGVFTPKCFETQTSLNKADGSETMPTLNLAFFQPRLGSKRSI